MREQQTHIGDEQNRGVRAPRPDTRELEDAVSRYLPSLYRRAYRYVGDPHDAEDAVQDALLSAYKHLAQFKATAKMSTWLTAIVTNSALMHLRKRRRSSHVWFNDQLNETKDYSLSDMLADTRPSPEAEYAGSESRAFLMQFFSELSLPVQEAFRLRYMDGLPTSDAARILNVSVPAMKSRLWRARTHLKRRIRGL